MQHISTQAQDSDTGQRTTMDPHSTTATTSFNFLGLPQELRDDIYETAIFDLSPPEMFMFRQTTNGFAYRSMSTNILLTSRKIYREARDVIMRRGQLVMVCATRLHSELFRVGGVPVDTLTGWSGITVIHPMYRNLCVMNHRINAARTSRRPVPNSGGDEWEFIVHRKDIEPFCHALMGKFNHHAESILGPRSTHTLTLHCPQGYAQHECTSFFWAQERILQVYRSILRGFEDVSILGISTGWESGLYSATLEDIRSTDGKVVGGFIDDLRNLEKEGFDTLAQTGDLEAADASLVRAIGVCHVARITFIFSSGSSPVYYERTSVESNTKWWAQLRRQSGGECAVPVIHFWYRLIRIRLSNILRFIQRGGHLEARHGRAPVSTQRYLDFVRMRYRESKVLTWYFQFSGWVPRPSEEAQMCFAAAAIYRLLDASGKAAAASRAILRATKLAPEDESIERERFRVDTWIQGLLDEGRMPTQVW